MQVARALEQVLTEKSLILEKGQSGRAHVVTRDWIALIMDKAHQGRLLAQALTQERKALESAVVLGAATDKVTVALDSFFTFV